MDVGIGAGFPGVPLAIAFPDISITLLEATAKKIRFLQHVVEKLGLRNTDIIEGRAEDIGHDDKYREAFDIVLSRAVAPLATLVELTLPFCKTGGIVIAWKKGDIKQELEESNKGTDTLGGRIREVRPMELPEFDDKRCLVIIDKLTATPSRYPRRSGIPAKRPVRG